MEGLIKKLLREFGGDEESKPEGKKSDEKKIDSDSDKKARYDKIKGLLANPIFNHAEICNQLWGDKEATNRSLFRKKLEMELNDNGTPYEFDDEEIAKIGSILRDTSKQITKTVGRKGS